MNIGFNFFSKEGILFFFLGEEKDEKSEEIEMESEGTKKSHAMRILSHEYALQNM